jgi:hypothetical protein
MAADREGLGVQAAYSVTKLANWMRRGKRTKLSFEEWSD